MKNHLVVWLEIGATYVVKRIMVNWQTIALMIVVFLFSAPANASIIGVGGDMIQIAAPSSVVAGALEGDDTIFAFEELHIFELATDLTVDVLLPGTYGQVASQDDFPQGLIVAGTLVNSYFLHSDPVGTPTAVGFNGSVTFDQDILGVIFTTNLLSSTHALLGAPSTTYDNNFFNIFLNDQFVLSADHRTLTMNAITADQADHIRILTAASIPEPTGVILLGLGALVVTTRFKSRRSTA